MTLTDASEQGLTASSTGKGQLVDGQVVRVRTRTYLVESVLPSAGIGTQVRLACLVLCCAEITELRG
ncbi:MAG TPA: hypothetical protein VFC44_06010 [Candidatus Saccharimonadales bacterium]|nr:hypothetical protein [Candidatus Saccharimonadales bacterium]